MKARFFLLLMFLALLAFLVPLTYAATTITFDELSETGSGSFIANGYQGLNWSNFFANNAILYTNQIHLVTGDYYGMVSASNVASDYAGDPAEIDSAGTNFNFVSAYLTGFINSNLNIQVQGFNGGTMLFNTTVVASATSPTLVTFNYLNIDRLTFSPSGGQPAFGAFPYEQFVMDNLTFEFVPEPSTFLLAALGALTLWPFLKRRRA